MLLAPRLDTATETTTDLLKYDLVFSRRVALMSLFLVAVETYRRSFFNDFVVSQLFSEPTHALPAYQYEFIVVNGQNTTSTFHKAM